MKLGLIGKNVKYSYSKQIFEYLFSYTKIKATYDLIQLEQLDFDLIQQYDGLNVTMPYKLEIKTLLNYPNKESVNTIKHTKDGYELYNTDFFGFEYTYRKLIGNDKVKSAIILGSGAMSQMISNYFERLNIKTYIVSRKASKIDHFINYTEILNYHADIIINTTPIGMYPQLYQSPINKKIFENVKYAIDLIYRPYTTQFLWDAKAMKVKCINGMDMLIIQALKAFEIWTNYQFSEEQIDELLIELKIMIVKKVLLIGMPLSGKTTMLESSLFQSLAKYDIDLEITKYEGSSIAEIFKNNNETYFRELESSMAKKLAEKENCVISSGGGLVLNESNMVFFREFICIYLNVPLKLLISRYSHTQTLRPLVNGIKDIETIYYNRLALYERYSDIMASEIHKRENIDAILF